MRHILTVFIILFSSQLFCQNENWKNYTNKEVVFFLYETNNKIYIGGHAGVIVRDLQGNVLEEYTRCDGLASNSVFGITSDADGNMWFGAGLGVSRFDGTNWTTYDSSNSQLPDQGITSIAADNQGNIWVTAFAGGLYRFNGVDWTMDQNFGSASLNQVMCDQQGHIRLAASAGAWEYNGTSWSVITNNNVSRICQDLNGDFWFVVPNGLSKYDGNSWTIFTSSNSGLPNDAITFIGCDHIGNVWVGCALECVSKFDGTTWTLFNTQNSSLISNSMNAFAVDSNGDCWFGTEGGVNKYSGNQWNTYSHGGSSLPANVVFSVEVDQTNQVWAASGASKASRFTGIEWVTHDFNLAPSTGVEVIYSDYTGNMWFGSFGSLTKYDGANWTTWNSGNSNLPDAEINVISEEGNGDLWIGTTGSGVLKFDGSSFAIYTSSNSNLPHDHVTGIAKGQQGQIWVSTYLGGAAKFDGTDWIVFNDTNSDLSDNMLRAMETDQDGMIWFCTYDEGLDRFDGTNWVHFDYPNPGFIGEVADLFINNQNILWIASDQGLYQFNGTEWTSFTTENSPMEDNLIRTVTGDAENNIWIGTSYHGIYKYSPNQGVSIMENEMNNSEMTIFPNPSSDHSKINFENANGKGAVLSVFDLSGKLLLRKETNEDHFVVDRNGLKSPGIYLISVQTQSKSFTGKLVVE